MITFNGLLRFENLEPKGIRLARHKDSRNPGRPSPYQLWRAADGRFEDYQRIQSGNVFQRTQHVASFVVTPLSETLFVGLYTVTGLTKAPAGMLDPVTGVDVGGLNLYTLEPAPQLADYRGRLVIKWGPGYRAWVQLAVKQDKPVIEIRRTVSDPPFPGFLNFSERLSALATVPQAWRVALSSVGGVYLLAEAKKGELYVGSAHGPAGFWGRWEDYAASGHGGNKRMREIPDGDYQVSVLEVASSATSLEELIAMENRWKRKLRSRQFGLNGN